MNTALVWLLISLPHHSTNSSVPARPVTTVAQFADQAECKRVGSILMQRSSYAIVECIQARVAVIR